MFASLGGGGDRVEQQPLLIVTRSVRLELGVQRLPLRRELVRLARSLLRALRRLLDLLGERLHGGQLNRLAAELHKLRVQPLVRLARLSARLPVAIGGNRW